MGSLPLNSILSRVDDIEKYDRIPRRNYGLSGDEVRSDALNLNVLPSRGRTLIAVEQPATTLTTRASLRLSGILFTCFEKPVAAHPGKPSF